MVVEASVVVNHHFNEGEALLGLFVHAKDDDFLDPRIDLARSFDVLVKKADGENELGPRVLAVAISPDDELVVTVDEQAQVVVHTAESGIALSKFSVLTLDEKMLRFHFNCSTYLVVFTYFF